MPTYREPADPPSGLVDPNALAASVVELETAYATRKAQREEREAERRREAKRIAAEKAAAQKPRVSVRRDPGGTLLSFPVQSPSMGTLISSWVGLTLLLALITWMFIAIPAGLKLLTLIVVPLVGFPLYGLRLAWVHRRPVHLYATGNGFFIAYRHDPEAPFAMGRTKHLKLDLRRDGSKQRVMPLYGGGSLLEAYCDRLTVRDVAIVKMFGDTTGIRVD